MAVTDINVITEFIRKSSHNYFQQDSTDHLAGEGGGEYRTSIFSI
jgi:hypothetical protein